MINVVIDAQSTPDTVRDILVAEVSSNDTIEVEVVGELRFSLIRSCIAVINTVAFARSCLLRYSGEREFRPPPLGVHYSHEPNIHPHAQPKNS